MIADALNRIGVIYPTGGGELDWYQFAETVDPSLRMYLVSTRLYGEDQDHDIDALMKSGDIAAMGVAARKVRELNLRSMIWACTSGSFVGGLDWSRAQAEAICANANCPGTTTSLAFASALEQLGLSRVAIMASYPPVVAERFEKFLGECGKTIVKLHALDIISGWDAAQLGTEQMMAAVRAADCAQAEAILIPDTALPTLHLIAPLERELGKPILTANQVSIWECLRLAKMHYLREDLGALFGCVPA